MGVGVSCIKKQITYLEFRALSRLGCISLVTLSLWPSEPRWQLANDLCHIMIQQPVSNGWPLFHCVCFIATAIVSLQFGVGILIYIFHIFYPIFIFKSYWFAVVVVVAMWIYLRESLVSLSLPLDAGTGLRPGDKLLTPRDS